MNGLYTQLHNLLDNFSDAQLIIGGILFGITLGYLLSAAVFKAE